MNKTKYYFVSVALLCFSLVIIISTFISTTNAKYVTSVNSVETFEMHVNPQSSSAMNISTVTIKLHSNEDQSNKGKTDVIGEVVGFVNAEGSPHLQSCPNVVPPTNDGFVFLGYYGFIGQNAVKVFDSTGKSVGTEVFDDVYALWTKIETE